MEAKTGMCSCVQTRDGEKTSLMYVPVPLRSMLGLRDRTISQLIAEDSQAREGP